MALVQVRHRKGSTYSSNSLGIPVNSQRPPRQGPVPLLFFASMSALCFSSNSAREPRPRRAAKCRGAAPHVGRSTEATRPRDVPNTYNYIVTLTIYIVTI